MAPNVAFIGVCERAVQTAINAYSLIGLKDVHVSPIFPLRITDFFFAFALYGSEDFTSCRIELVSPSNTNVMRIELAVEAARRPESASEAEHVKVIPEFPAWSFHVLKLHPLNNALIAEPGAYKVILLRDGQQWPIGQLMFIHSVPEPLTIERINAIRADPRAAKAVRFELACQACGDATRAYAGLDRNVSVEQQGFQWHLDLPERFECRCGKASFSLAYLKAGLPALLGRKRGADDQDPFNTVLTTFESNAVGVTRTKFREMLGAHPGEEDVQKFIEENQVVLHALSPERLYFKAPILSSFFTDFAIVTPNRSFLLIEIERPDLKLLTKQGSIASGLQHAFDQVNDWLLALADHKAAVLEAFGLSPKDVTAIGGVVIAGRDVGYSEPHMRKLKWSQHGNGVKFFTYDDLLGDLGLLERTLTSL